MKKKVSAEKPTIEELEAELERERKKYRRRSVLKGILCTLIVLAAILILAAAFYLPTLVARDELYFFLYNLTM
ncbi:MAG: hypothetical protein UHS54_05235 [Lachnospiraceae bacterium]|nr:hypothetical protein [Lachnospiraceae bacterium]